MNTTILFLYGTEHALNSHFLPPHKSTLRCPITPKALRLHHSAEPIFSPISIVDFGVSKALFHKCILMSFFPLYNLFVLFVVLVSLFFKVKNIL